MGIAILIVSVLAIAGAVVWFFLKNKKEEPSIQTEEPISEPSNPPVEVPKEDEKEPEKPKEEEVQPMFKVGDFVVSDYCMGMVVEITSDAYLLDTGQGIPFSCEHNAHIWNIHDAKDGDILVCVEDKRPFIFKGLLDKFHPENPVAYCGIDSRGIFTISSGDGWWTDEEVQPANKEQIDFLFAKMKEAGYMWYAEKKELEEIAKPQEPTPTEVPKEEPKEESVLQEPTVKEMPKKTLGDCINAFGEFVSVPNDGMTYKFLESLYNEAQGQFNGVSYNELPLLYKKENFPNVYDIYGGRVAEGASFNSMMGWVFALLLMGLKPKKRNQIGKIGYEFGGYTYSSPIFGYEFKSDPNVARLVGSMVLAAMLGKKQPDLRAMSAEIGGTTYPNGLSYYLDIGLNHLKTADDVQKNVVSKSGFYVDFRQFMPSSAGPYDKNYKSRPANIMTDAKDEYLNTKMDRDIHEFIVKTFNLDTTDLAIHQRTVQAIADKEQSVNHLFGSNKIVGGYEFSPVFGKNSIGKKIKTDGGIANLAWSIQAIATYFRLVLQNKADSPAYYGRLRPGCDWTEEKKKNSSTDDRRNILVDITIEDNDGEKESSYGYYNDEGIWVHTEVEASKFAEEQKNHLGANSYPSGHSSGIWCVAMMLSELMPEKTDLIMREANEFSINRTVTRFHWTSDTIFGRILGSVANLMCHATTDYLTLLGIAKKEL